MLFALIKALLSGAIVLAVSELAKRSPSFGALVASLPLVSVLAMIWLWRETGDAERIAAHAEATFWYVLPSLPMFLIFPALLRSGYGFWSSLSFVVVVTFGFYLIVALVAARFGIKL